MTTSNSMLRRPVALNAIAWSMIGLFAALVFSRSHTAIAEWLEPVRAEIPGWPVVSLGAPANDPLPEYHLVVAPEVLRAARLMLPSLPAAAADHWWFPARLLADSTPYEVEAQIVVQPRIGEGLRLRFRGRERPLGARALEFQPASPERDILDQVAREAAAEIGLLAAPGGFAHLRINGGNPGLVHWREGNSTAMLQRLGLPSGAIFRATTNSARSHANRHLPRGYVAASPGRTRRAHADALARFVELVRNADDKRFRGEIANVVDVDQVLAWNAIALFFSDPAGGDPDAPDWYFDTISGLLRPIIRSLIATPVERALPRDAQQLVSRLLEAPAFRAQRDALLRSWVGVTRSERLEAADERLGVWASTLAASGAPFARIAELARLAELRRSVRHAMDTRVAALRRLVGPGSPPATRAVLASASQGASSPQTITDWVEHTGLPLRIEGDAVVVPAGTHHIASTLVVPQTHRLVIEPGARLVMAPDASVLTFRRLEAVGTRKSPIEIRALDPSEPWGSIGVARAPGRSELAYVTVSGGSNARHAGIEFTGELAFNASDVVIRDCDVRDGHGDDAMSVRRGSFHVTRTRFIDSASDGFDAEWARGSIEQSLFANNGDDGLDLATSEVRVHRSWFRRMGDKAISAGERSRVTISDTRLVDSQIAIAAKEDSRVEVEGSEFRRNEIGISLYRDNRVFGSGYGTISGGLFAENLRDFAVETGSGLTLNGVERRESDASGIVIGSRDTSGSMPSALQ